MARNFNFFFSLSPFPLPPPLPLSAALRAAPGGGTYEEVADYSRHWLTADSAARAALATRLAAVGSLLEASLGGPQDVEGGVAADGSLFIVQARPQP